MPERSGTRADDPFGGRPPTFDADRVQTRYHAHGAPAWLATSNRI